MKIITKDAANCRQDKPFARNAASTQTGRATKKQKRTDGIREKSRPIRLTQQIPGWYKQLDTLMHSVEKAWAAAETMRTALEERDQKTRQSTEEEPLNDVF